MITKINEYATHMASKGPEYSELKSLDSYFMHECPHPTQVREWDAFMDDLFDQDETADGKIRQYLNELYDDEIVQAVEFGKKLKGAITAVAERKRILESNMSGDSVVLTELSNGNLSLKVNDEGKAEIEDLQSRYGGDENQILGELLDSYFGNGYSNLTGQIGLTDSFIIGIDWDLDDKGEWIETDSSKAWMLPDYMVVDYAEKLKKEGEIIFTLASQS